MAKRAMRKVFCSICEEQTRMKYVKTMGPYDKWFDQTLGAVVTSQMAGSRIAREFWVCPKCHTVRWFDMRIDDKRPQSPEDRARALRRHSG